MAKTEKKTPHDQALEHLAGLKALTSEMKFEGAGGTETSVHAQLHELFTAANRTIKAHAATVRT